MGLKCCAPYQKPNVPLHIILLNSLYIDVKLLEDHHKKSKRSFDEMEVAVVLAKKGHIKKLCDYLSYHIHYICESIRLILFQLKNKKNVYALAASSQISLRIVKMTKEIHHDSTEEDDKKNSSKIMGLKFSQEFQQTIFEISLELLEQYLVCPQQVIPLLSQTVNNTLTMLKEVSLEEKSTKIPYQIIKKLLDAIIQIINLESREKKIGIQVYRQIIQKYKLNIMNARIYRDIVKDHLWKFISVWVSDALQYNRSSNEIENQKITILDDNLFEGILVQFFNSIFSFQESEYIYKQLMFVYDNLEFDHVLIQIQGLVFNSLDYFELKQQFSYRWFDYMLNYLAVTEDYYEGIWLISGLQEPYDSMKKKHKNILQESNAIGCLKTVKRWVEGGQIDIGNILQYKSQKLFMAILLNLSNFDPKSKILDQTCQTIDYLVHQHSLFYVELILNIYTIIKELQSEYYSKNEKCKSYLEQLIKLISTLCPKERFKQSQSQIQKLSQYERLYEIIFQPLKTKKMVNNDLVKGTAEVLRKIGVKQQTSYLQKLTNYLASVAKILQEYTDQRQFQSFILQINDFLICLKVHSPYVLKPYLNYLLAIYKKSSHSSLIMLGVKIYTQLQTPKNSQNVLNKNRQSSQYYENLVPHLQNFGKFKKSELKSYSSEKFFDILIIEHNQIVLQLKERNSIESHFCRTSSLGQDDQNFDDVINSIKKN